MFKPLFVVSIILLFSLLGCSASPATTATPTTSSGKYSKPPEMSIDVNKKYTATIQTDKGNIEIELFAKDAPKTVNSFVFLARQGYYDGLTFHRVISNFVAQGGDPTGTGSGGPGYTFEDEKNSYKMETGMLAMANSGPNTNGSQFFITLSPQHQLDGYHTIFGRVTKGMEVVARLTPRDPLKSPGTTTKGDRMNKIIISESN